MTAADSSKWMLETTFPDRPPDYLEISENGFNSSTGFDDLEWRPAQDDNGERRSRPASLELVCRKEGSAVRLLVSIQFHAASGRSSQMDEVPVGTYLVKTDESVKLSELTRFGLDPPGVKILSSKPPDSTPPTVVNQVSSLVVGAADEDRAFDHLTMQNTSSLAVEGVMVVVVGADGARDEHPLRPIKPPLIGPGETGGFMTLKDSNPANPVQLVIEAVDFEDGTHEGNEFSAAILEATHAGREAQQKRIAGFVEKQLLSNTADDASKIEMLRSEVSALPVQPEAHLVESVLAKFPGLTGSEEGVVRYNLRYGLEMEKSMFLRNLKEYVLEMSQEPEPNPSVQKWWDITRGQCDFMANWCGGKHP